MMAKSIRRLPELVFLTWIIIFSWLFFSGDYIKYLRPDFHFFMIIGALLSFLVFCGGILLKRDKIKLSLIISNSLLILLPVVFYYISSGSYLGSFAFSKKKTQASLSNNFENNKINWERKTVKDKNKLTKFTLSQLTSRLYNLNGALIETDGQIFKDEEKSQILIYRFLVTCCVADASPIGVFLPYNDLTKDLTNDEWVKVRGRFDDTQKINKRTVWMIKAESIEKISPPKLRDRYLYY